MWEYLLFDLDGTLTDSGPGIMNSARYAFRKLGKAIPDEAVLRSFIGPPLAESFAPYFPPERIDLAIATFREYYQQTGWLECTPYPGIRDCLLALRASGAQLAVATSKFDAAACRVLEHFGLADMFSVISGAPENDPAHAAKDYVIRSALARLGCTDVRRAVMIGDRKYDILGARKTGLRSVGVLYGYGSREELLQAGADMLAESVAQLPDLLRSARI